MGEFASMEEDWSLEAIVRGCTDDHLAAMSSSFDNYTDDFLFDHDDTLKFNDFDQLYKPFYRVFYDSFSKQVPIGSSTNYTSSSSSSNDKALKLESEETKMKNSPKSTTVHAIKYKKRKNQHKKVLLQAEGLSSDTWAWRKYGQKPIKGSPYPRSYYKCSSSKGCLARKQVEQSCTDPGMFIITYTAEHEHSQPTRRSSLAGTNRHKFTAYKNSSPGHGSAVATPKSSVGSPTTPLRSSHIEEEAFEKSGCEITNENECQLLADDFFVGLENLDSFISESGFYNFPFQSNI